MLFHVFLSPTRNVDFTVSDFNLIASGCNYVDFYHYYVPTYSTNGIARAVLHIDSLVMGRRLAWHRRQCTLYPRRSNEKSSVSPNSAATQRNKANGHRVCVCVCCVSASVVRGNTRRHTSQRRSDKADRHRSILIPVAMIHNHLIIF